MHRGQAVDEPQLTSEEIRLLRQLRRYLALGDPLGPRATLPAIVRYLTLLEASEAAQHAGDARAALAYRLQAAGLRRQGVVSRLVTLGMVLLLLLLALGELRSASNDYQRIGPALQGTFQALATPDFSRLDSAFLLPDPLRGRFTPDPQAAFAPVLADYRQRTEASLREAQGGFQEAVAHARNAAVLALAALLWLVLQPQEVGRRWLAPLVGKLLTREPPPHRRGR
ncbi:MAG: hypothetical protein K6U89_01770 [Chloroflexi bacterium]|nr:hypothetical protein [Chloroflexota bacterium]